MVVENFSNELFNREENKKLLLHNSSSITKLGEVHMKSLIALSAIVSAFLLMSCSNVDQDLSTVGPETEKISVSAETGTYPYLQSFNFIPIDSYTILPGGSEIEIVVGNGGWSDDVEHIYVVLEYIGATYPSADVLVYLEKPRTVSFQLDGCETNGLQGVKVYGYEPAVDKRVISPYNPLREFDNVAVQWFDNGRGINLKIQGDTRLYNDSFVEVITSQGSFVSFVDVPQSDNIFIPKSGPTPIPVETISVRLFTMQITSQN